MDQPKPESDNESIAARLARADREIRLAQLEQRVRNLGGVVGTFGAEDEDLRRSELIPSWLGHVLAWETGPASTHRAWLARHGWTFARPDGLRRHSLKKELWRLICALAVARVFLYHTNHLSDAELYSRLWNEVLEGDCPDSLRTRDDACHWDMADPGSGDEQLWLVCYASDEERHDWVCSFPDVCLPPKRKPDFRRDHRLPVRD